MGGAVMEYYVNLEHRSEEARRSYEKARAREGRERQSTTIERGNRAKTKTVDGPNGKRRLVKKHFKVFSVRSGMDMPFFFLVLVLLVIGITMMFSASYAFAYHSMGDSYYFLKRQLMWAIVGVVAMVLISYFDYHHLHKAAVPVLGVAFFLLTLVLFLPPVNQVKRWIDIGVTMIQPSEIMKFALILFFAHWASIYFNKMDTFKYGVLPAICILVPTVILLFFEPHYSCIVIVTIITMVMMFLSGVKVRWFAFAGAGILLVFLVLYATDNLTYAMERMNGWGMALEENKSEELKDAVWQTMNSLYAIGSGGLTGLGLGQSRQKYLYLPEPQNDFVFAIVCEELGVIGAVIILAIFALLIWRGITVSLRAKDQFGMLLGMGLTAQVGIQVVINILVITDMLPNTGISLPFFSYGGSSLVMVLMQMGIILSISRNANVNKT